MVEQKIEVEKNKNLGIEDLQGEPLVLLSFQLFKE